MSNQNDYGRPPVAVTGPGGTSAPRNEPEELSSARPGAQPNGSGDAAWPPPVYRDVTGRPIPLAAGWERPDGERPRDHAHQRWAGAAAAMKDEAASLFAADTRQSGTDYEPPVSYPATAGGSAFFSGARQAASEQQTARAESGAQPVYPAAEKTRPETQPPPPPAVQPQASPYDDYPQTAPGGLRQPYTPFEDYQTGAQPQVQDWDDRDSQGYEGHPGGYQDDQYQDDRQTPGWQQVQPSQQLGGYANTGGYPAQDETRRADWSDATGPMQRRGQNPGYNNDYSNDARNKIRPWADDAPDVHQQQGWAPPAPQEPYEPDPYAASGPYYGGAPVESRTGGFPDPEREYDQIRQRGGRLLDSPGPDHYDRDEYDDYEAGHDGLPPQQRQAPGFPGNPPNGGKKVRRRIGYRRRAGAAVLIVAALAVGRFVSQFETDDFGQTRPFLLEGRLGSAVELRSAQITATEVDGSACVSAGFYGTFRSPGVFVVVPVKIVAKGKTANMEYAAIEDSEGRLYTTSTNGRSSFEAGTAQAGITRYATVAIEMPKDRVAGARLRIALNDLYLNQDDMTDIDLGITQKDVDGWVRNQETLAVTESSNFPPGQQPDDSTDEPLAACAGPVVPE
ncbi:hypothetical protein [Kineosporia babensis]|uniref:DUF4352 domain-containing protein n=1 Tax=Kineosporia babensis TaxID=499548 RepID=A0A9X1STU1_9ACTN|nr:hypothetical protein [Kineosporia babensis]MCD5311696.1 hypothetical protein [Kineosporia babensis]